MERAGILVAVVLGAGGIGLGLWSQPWESEAVTQPPPVVVQTTDLCENLLRAAEIEATSGDMFSDEERYLRQAEAHDCFP